MTFKYEGDLNKPIPAPPYDAVKSASGRAEIAQILSDLQQWKLSLLFDAHGVSQGDWQSLCLALAEAHVPGMQITRGRRGRPKKWDFFMRAQLFVAVERTGVSNITEATKLLAGVEPWRSLVAHTRGAATLRDEYARTDKGWIEMWRKVHRLAIDDAE